MKLLQNPVVVGSLAVVALALVFRNALAPIWQRAAHRPTATRAEQPAPVESTANVLPTTPATPEVVVPNRPRLDRIQPEASIDLAQVGWKANGTPRRDPFQINPATITNLARLYPPAGDLFSLKAIWRQTGSSLAVINGRVLNVGDAITALVHSKTAGEPDANLKFQIQSIEDSSVWLEGPGGREQLEFKTVTSVPTSAGGKAKTDGTAMK